MSDDQYMLRAIELAQLGLGLTYPNPLVGAVIVHNNRIIGEGYHQKAGEGHAEVNAIASVAEKDLLSECTIYVTLEPCSHFGKTPPCADLIIKHNFKRVVIGSLDPFKEVNGKGIARLRNAGIDVQLGVLENRCVELNKRFFCYHQNKRPYIVLKWAQTLDGFIDKKRDFNDKGVNWITKPETQSLVHSWRSQENAILVGTNTVVNDDPSLDVRMFSGNNPVRVVIDKDLKLKDSKRVFNKTSKTLILNSQRDELTDNIQYVKLSEINVLSILNCLYQHNIQSVLIEGGADTLTRFLDADLWDEARVLVGSSRFEVGLKAPEIAKVPAVADTFGTDKVFIYRNTCSH